MYIYQYQNTYESDIQSIIVSPIYVALYSTFGLIPIIISKNNINNSINNIINSNISNSSNNSINNKSIDIFARS